MNLIKGLKLMGIVYVVWPLSSDSTSLFKRIIYLSVWWFHFINYIIGILFTLNTCYKGRKDINLVTFSSMEVLAFIESLTVLIIYKYYVNLLKRLLIQIEEYMKSAGLDRKFYLKERGAVFAVMMVLIMQLYGIIIVLYITNPVETKWETFLTTAYYPPSIRTPVIDALLLTHQLAAMLHSSVMIVFDIIVVTLIYGCTVRLKVLAKQFGKADRYEELLHCVRQHQEILILASDTIKVVRFVIMKTVSCFVCYTVGAGLQIVNPKATTVSLERFGVVLLINSVRLIMIALSADDLSVASKEIGSSVYSTIWYNDDKDMVIAKKLIMLRCQSIVKVSVAGLITALSLSYTTGIISSAVSYFTTLRAITGS
ncbi:uncharacterized protein LOC131665427 [Phymastichus coffea]|uniref:uncharacterized protein LOC131665427 n=1 Tax=Phymastichus coffea TaxID=108790 RepID=UPI00273AA0AE|nr:uncharacterized protein LOC131665427 [Phymastichus coffea]